MDQDTRLRVNWLNVNVPTIASIVGMAVLFMNWSSGLTATQVRQDARLEQIEESRATKARETAEQFALIMTAIAKLPNLDYRLTVAESGIVAANQRIDRQSDAIGDLRDGISRVNTSIEVLTQRIESALPLKKSALDITTPELATR